MLISKKNPSLTVRNRVTFVGMRLQSPVVCKSMVDHDCNHDFMYGLVALPNCRPQGTVPERVCRRTGLELWKSVR